MQTHFDYGFRKGQRGCKDTKTVYISSFSHFQSSKINISQIQNSPNYRFFSTICDIFCLDCFPNFLMFPPQVISNLFTGIRSKTSTFQQLKNIANRICLMHLLVSCALKTPFKVPVNWVVTGWSTGWSWGRSTSCSTGWSIVIQRVGQQCGQQDYQ